MNGAEALTRTLADRGVQVCFTNPGTSELHIVEALGADGRIRNVLCLFEGAVTGAADGYGRMTGRPAAALLHLGPGLSNGLANLHNARRARTPLLSLIGDHATYHKRFDAPLESDIDALAGTVSAWVRRTERGADAASDAAEAVAAAMAPPGGIATLIVPAEVSWSEVSLPGDTATDITTAAAARHPATVPEDVIASAARTLRAEPGCAILLGGPALRRPGLLAAGRIAAATGARLLCEPFPARRERGAGIPAAGRLAYLPEMASAQLAGTRHLILAGARAPVTFFAYPGVASSLVPEGCQVHPLAEAGDDVCQALTSLAELVATSASIATGDPAGSGKSAAEPPATVPERDTPLTAESAAAVIGALLPEGAIVCDEANTCGYWLEAATVAASPHDWLSLTGGAIGQGLPLAIGAAVACPDRGVIALEADGSAMYTISALWTHAREQLDITTVIFSNRGYAILGMEVQRLGLKGTAPDLLELTRPDLDFTALAAGMGVPASRAGTSRELAAQFRRALAEPGPHLIEAMLSALPAAFPGSLAGSHQAVASRSPHGQKLLTFARNTTAANTISGEDEHAVESDTDRCRRGGGRFDPGRRNRADLGVSSGEQLRRP
ncbi:MAG TPA: acetolactate synthase large subunit [Streptosporangiaceae bacterium]